MAFGPEDKKIEDGMQAGHLILEVAGLVFPPLAIVASDVGAFNDLYKFLSDHVSNTPGLSTMPGPPLNVQHPWKW